MLNLERYRPRDLEDKKTTIIDEIVSQQMGTFNLVWAHIHYKHISVRNTESLFLFLKHMMHCKSILSVFWCCRGFTFFPLFPTPSQCFFTKSNHTLFTKRKEQPDSHLACSTHCMSSSLLSLHTFTTVVAKGFIFVSDKKKPPGSPPYS